MAVKRGPAKASAHHAAWRWQLICAAVSVAAGACCFASGAPPLPGVYIDEGFLKDLADAGVEQNWFSFSPFLMDIDNTFREALRYLCHHIPGVGDAAMEEFRVGVENPNDPDQFDMAIRMGETDWVEKYLALRPKLEPLVHYSVAIREEELETLANLIFQNIDRSIIPKTSEPRLKDKMRCVLRSAAAFKNQVETQLGRSVTNILWSTPGRPTNEPRESPEGIDTWIDYLIEQLPNGSFELTIYSHASSKSNIQKKTVLQYTGIYSWTPEEGPKPQQRLKLTEIHNPDFANYSKFPERGGWEATRRYHNTWDGNCVTVVNKKNPRAEKGKCESALNEKTYTWRKGNDLKANKLKENMMGKIKYHANSTITPSKYATLNIMREKSLEDGKDETLKVERIFELDPIPATFRIFFREEPLPESGMRALHSGLYINAKSLTDSDSWPTLESTFAFEMTRTVKDVPKYNDPTVMVPEVTSVDRRIAAQTGPNKRFLHLSKLEPERGWEFDNLMYEEQEMVSSVRKTELRKLMISDEPNLEKAQPDLARQLGINVSNEWTVNRTYGMNIPYFPGFDQCKSRNNTGCRYDKNSFILGRHCTGAMLYLVANRILSSQAVPQHSRLSQVGKKRDWHSTTW